MFRKFFAVALGAAMLLSGAMAGEALAAKFVTIGTGGITGVYYPTGGAIAKIINSKKDVYNIRASVESTGASKFNINAINSRNRCSRAIKNIIRSINIASNKHNNDHNDHNNNYSNYDDT